MRLNITPLVFRTRLFQHSRSNPPRHTRMNGGVCMMDTYICAAPMRLLFESSRRMRRGAPSETQRAFMASQLCARASVNLPAHPCPQASRFLVHTRSPDRGGHLILGRPRRNPGALLRQEHHRVQDFVVTLSGADTMTRCDQDVDDITDAVAFSRSPVTTANLRSATHLQKPAQSTHFPRF